MTIPQVLILRAPDAGEPELYIKWADDHDDVIPLDWNKIVYLMAQCALIIKSWPDQDEFDEE